VLLDLLGMDVKLTAPPVFDQNHQLLKWDECSRACAVAVVRAAGFARITPDLVGGESAEPDWPTLPVLSRPLRKQRRATASKAAGAKCRV